ncbi:MAG: hypothetical protein HY331_05860 [Chloroflexi bacterium]|nr:hypothetical protein [Chloroflexota bacterium]
MATNPFLLWHGQDARMYTMATAFGLLATWATLTLTRRATGTSSWSGVPGPWLEKLRTAASSQKPETRNQKPETTDLVLYSAGATLAIFTHYAAVFLVLALNAVALASLRGRRLGIWLAVQAGIAALYLPWLVGVRELLLGHTKDWIAPTGPIEMARRTVVAFGVGSAVDPALGGWLALPFGVGLSLGAIGLIRRADGRRLLAVLALPIVLMSAVSIVRPMFDERYVVFIAPLAVAAVAIGLAPVAGRSAVGSGRSPVSGRQSAVSGVAAVAVRLASVAGSERFRSAGACPPPVLAPTEEAGDKPRRSVRIAGLRSAGAARTALRVLVAGATIVALGGYYADPRYAKSPEWRDLGRTVVERRQEGDLLLLTYPDPAPAFYVRDAVPRLLLPASFPLDPADTADHLAALTARRVWLVPVRAPNWDADGYVEQWLDARWKLIDQLRFRGPQLRLYLAPATALAVLPPREPVSFDGRIALVGAEVLPARPIQPGETLELSLYFRALGPAGQSYTVYNHLLDSGGTLRGQADGVPVRSMYPTDRWRPGEIVLDRYTIRVAADAPPGPYVIRTGLYDPKSGRRLPVLDVAGNPAADGVTIPGIRIAVAAR